MCREILRRVSRKKRFAWTYFVGCFALASLRTDFTSATTVQLHTDGYNYLSTGLDLRGKESLVFQLMAKDNALLAIVTTPGDHVNDMLEFVFRGPFSRPTVVKNETRGYVAAMIKSEVDYLQNGQQYVPIWISWSRDTLTMGLGNVVGQNILLIHHNINPIRRATTAEVSSDVPNFADWIFPLEQGSQVFTGLKFPPMTPTVDVDTAYCKDVAYDGQPDLRQTYSIPAFLQDRDYITFKADNYSTVVDLTLYSTKGQIAVTGLPVESFVFKNGMRLAYGFGLYLRELNSTTGQYWLSWSSRTVAVGRGTVLGENPLLFSFDTVQGDINITSLEISVKGSLTIPLGYFVGTTGVLRRSDGPIMRSMRLEKVASGACAAVCSVSTVDNAACSLTVCSHACISTGNCTGFCYRLPVGAGRPCTCELQAIPGNFMASSLLKTEPGASFWLMSS